MTYRENGKKALLTVLNSEKNISTFDKYIQINCEYMNTNGSEYTIEENYKRLVFQVIGDIISKKEIKLILIDIKKHLVGWEHNSFKYVKQRIVEHDDFIINPFEVVEGVTQCKNSLDGVFCGSWRVFTYQLQVRSSDEPMSTFAQCMNCKSKWSYSG
jgi:DNA-directed RNA polymerase subunit M/transcription elongation factor TFIIS